MSAAAHFFFWTAVGLAAVYHPVSAWAGMQQTLAPSPPSASLHLRGVKCPPQWWWCSGATPPKSGGRLQVWGVLGAVGGTGKRGGNSLQRAWGEGGKAGLPLWSGCALPGCRRVTGRGPASALPPPLWHRRSIQVCTLRTVLHQGKGLSSRTCTKSICMFNAPGCTQTCPGGRSMPVQMA